MECASTGVSSKNSLTSTLKADHNPPFPQRRIVIRRKRFCDQPQVPLRNAYLVLGGISLVVAIILTLLVYGDALRLPFYADDLQLIPWIKQTPAIEYWYRLNPYGDWRPLVFILLRAIYLLTGTLSPALLYGLNIAGHILCATLAGLLVARWGRGPRYAGPVVAALFALFPFAPNVVLWISSISYPLVTGLSLSALLLYLEAREHDHLVLHLCSALCTLMAGLVWEAGVVAAGGILLAELLLRRRPYSRWAGAHLVASAIPLTVIFILSSEVPTQLITGLHPWYNVVAWLQCLAYPLAQVVMPVSGFLGLNDILLMTVLGVLTLAGLAFLNARLGQFHWFLFALGWVLLWTVMPLTTQAFNWFRDPGRAFYPAAIGIVLLWGLTIADIGETSRRLWIRRGLQTIFLAAALLPAFVFLRQIVSTHRMVGDVLWETVAEAEASPGTLVINLPGRVTPERRVYPLMHEGMIPIPPPTSGEMFVAVHSDVARDFEARSMGLILPSGLPYALELADPFVSMDDLRAATRVFVVDYTAHRTTLSFAGAIRTGGERGAPLVTFGETVVLSAAECHWTGADELAIALEWQVRGLVSGNPTIFTHWIGPDGKLVTQSDGDALRGLYPIAAWQPGERIQEVRVLRGMSTFDGRVALGVWDPGLGERWSAVVEASTLLPDNVFYLPPCTGLGKP